MMVGEVTRGEMTAIYIYSQPLSPSKPGRVDDRKDRNHRT